VRVQDHQGRHRSVRILELLEETVIVDTNHRSMGQTLELEVELVGIHADRTDNPAGRQTVHVGRTRHEDEWQDDGGEG